MKEVIDFKIGEEYNVGDLLKIPKFGEQGKFILSMVVEDDIDDSSTTAVVNDAHSKTGYILRMIVVQETNV